MKKVTPKARRFIPFTREDLVEQCLTGTDLSVAEADNFRRVAQLFNSIQHYEFHQLLESLKRAYAPYDPNSDTRDLPELATSGSEGSFKDLLASLLNKANYEVVTEDDLNTALQESSLFNIRLQVDFDDFEEVLLFCRGEHVRNETLSSWFGLRKRVIAFTNFDRVVVYLKFKEKLDRNNPNCPPGSTMLKLFQDVPKADLEMLFPNTRVRMRLLDKLMIGVPAAVGGGIVVSTKLGGSLILLASMAGYWLGTHTEPVALDKTALIALLAGLAALGAHFWKQFNSFKNRKLKFIQTLTQNLYFKNLDNNAGVFYRLLDEAEEEESKEALLAYYFLLSSSEPLSAQELDAKVERWLENKLDCIVDFEIEDALQKLLRLNLITVDGGVRYRAIEMLTVLKSLDTYWDNLFTYGNGE